MEILREGQPWTHTVTCEKCDALLRLGLDDLLAEPRAELFGLSSGIVCYVRCPCCTSRVSLRWEWIPQRQHTYVKQRNGLRR